MHSTTLRQYLILLSALFFVTVPLHIHTMDTVTAATNTSIGNRLMTRFLTYDVYTSDDVVTAIRSILQLQQTCKFWFSELGKQNKKEIIETCFFNGQEIDLNKGLAYSLNQQRDQVLILKAHKKFSSKKSPIAMFSICDDRQGASTPEVYLFAGADVNGHNTDGQSFMGLAAAIQTKKYLRMFIKKGGNIMIADTQQEGYETRDFNLKKVLNPRAQEEKSDNSLNMIVSAEKISRENHCLPALAYPEVAEEEYLHQGRLHQSKTPYYYALDANCNENHKLIDLINGVLSTYYITNKNYPGTSIPNAREALDFIDKNVDKDGMICCYEDEDGILKHLDSDDE